VAEQPDDRQEQRVGERVVQYRRDRSARPWTSPSTARPSFRHELRRRSSVTRCSRQRRVRLDVPPRFGDPDEAGRAGSLVAPMPGAVLRVLVGSASTWSPGRRC
jgi:hypothetical protein